MVSLTQVLAWDLPLDSKIRARSPSTRTTLLGTVSLVEKLATPTAAADSKQDRDVLLRYNFRPPG